MLGETLGTPRREPERPEIPGYEIGELLGRGAMGAVWRARQLAIDREVALKVLHRELAHHPRLVRRIQREARTTARLAHPHVVSAIDMGQMGDTFWYAMEFVDGPSLAERLRSEGRLGEREALRLFIPLCEALQHLFDNGVVHRDIKPGNILIDRKGGARLADLGLAFAEDDPSLTRPGGTLGTPHYISPEQAVDPGRADVRSDIWSFGATLFHVVCGRPPFSGDSAAEILSAVLYARIPDPRELEPSLSKGLSLVLRKCLAREPEKRYQTPRELLLDLERVRERRAPKIRRASLSPVERSSGSPRRTLFLSAAAILAMVALALGYRALLGSEETGLASTEPSPTYAPLEELALRARRDTRALSAARRELADLREGLPADLLERWVEIERELSAELRLRLGTLQRECAAEVERHLAARDYAAADAALRVAFPARLLERTGYAEEDLEGQGIAQLAWSRDLARRIDGAAAAAATELETTLTEWSAARRAEVDRLLERQEWDRALDALDEGEAGIPAVAEAAGVRLPGALLDPILASAQTEFLLQRGEVETAWKALDRELSGWIRTRETTLAEELERVRPRPRAALDLVESFDLELERRSLSRAELPSRLKATCLTTLERSRMALLESEELLLEEDARAELDEVERLSGPYYAARRYADVRSLWEESAARLFELGERTRSAWLEELEHRAARRSAETILLEDVLERAAEGLRERAAAPSDLRVGAVTYPAVAIVPGRDPLQDGFTIEGFPGNFRLQELPPEELEALAGLEPERASPEERLALAVFRFYDGRLAEARAALRSGELPQEGVLGEIGSDLLSRIFDAVERQRSVREAESSVALRHLESVLDPSFQERAPSSVLAKLDLLLGQYVGEPAVRARVDELRALRDRLRSVPLPSSGEVLRSRFGPSALSMPRVGRVELAFDFQGQVVGAWQRRDWTFDGAGWSLPAPVERWEDLVAEDGPQLLLEAPLDIARFDLELEFEAVTEEPHKLLFVSAAGFHVALCGNGLVESGLRARYLAGTGDPELFLARVRQGEGRVEDGLFALGKKHTLRLRAYRPTGHLRIEFDGRLLRELRGSPASEADRSIEIRSWERMRLVRATIEAGI
jgi:serine/threonine protein kinase